MSIDWDAAVIGPTCDVFGDAVTYMPQYGAPFSVANGVFDKPFQKEDILHDGSVGVTTTKPGIGVQLSQFPKLPVEGDRIFIPSENCTYIVRQVRPDSHGWAYLKLNKVGVA